MNVYKALSHTMCLMLMAGCYSVAIRANAEERAIEEIIVRAQHRDQSLQDASVAVTVIDNRVLEEFGIDRIQGLSDFTPGMTINTSPGTFTGPSIRGIGTNSGVQTFEQSVGLFVDGVFSGRFRQYQASVFDIERVEVVKGGQGTLYGRNSSVGVISLTTRTPGTEFGGDLNVEYETEFNTRVMNAAVDLPISESFRIRLAGKDLDDPGYVRNTATGDDTPDRDEQALRLTALWEPSDSFEAIVRYTYSDFEIFGTADEITRDPGFHLGPLPVTLSGDIDSNPLAEGRGNNTQSLTNPFFEPDDEQETTDLSLTLNWLIGGHELTSITAISDLETTINYDSDGVSGTPNFGFPAFTTGFDEDFEQITQEIRLASPTGDKLEYLVGAFYIDQEYEFDLRLFANADPTPGFSTDVAQEMSSWSVFGQATWNFNDSTRLTTSVRYTDEEKDGLIRVLGVPGVIPDSFNSEILEDDSIDWAITLARDFGDNMIYITGSRSTKSGGIPNNPAALIELFLPAEEVTAVEFGWKILLDAGFINVAAYEMDLKNYQSSYFDGAVFQSDSLDGSSRGLELDSHWQVTDALRLRGSAAYNDTNVDDSDLGFTRAPELTASLALDYETPVGDNYRFQGSLWAVYTDEFFHQPTFDPGLSTVSHTKVHARLGATHEPSGLEVAVFVANLTDKAVQEFAYDALIPGLAGAPQGTIIAPVSRPRTVALQVSYSF